MLRHYPLSTERDKMISCLSDPGDTASPVPIESGRTGAIRLQQRLAIGPRRFVSSIGVRQPQASLAMNIRRLNPARMTSAVYAIGYALIAVAISISAPAIAATAQDDEKETKIRDSVVKISATLRYPELTRPWSKPTPREASGSGVVIDGKRILTNAHVVLYASQLFVESSQSSEKLAAHVEAVGPGIDLAVIRLDEESFFEKRVPLIRSSALPEIKETVLVYGYPQGGSTLSVTKGIVSRIEFTRYDEEVRGLRVQIDAAINPGNSGGPALIDGKMVGLIFSKLTQADNIGYIIPSEEIDLFLKDVADGKYDGKPAIHDGVQSLENEALRSYVGLDKKAQGLVVHAADPNIRDDPLQPFDLITKIGDHAIDNVGMVKIRENLRLNCQYLIQRVARDGKVPLTVVRKGKTMAIDLPVKTTRTKLFAPLKGKYPSYFIYGPLVFSPVSAEFAGSVPIARLTPALAAIGSPLATRRGDFPKFEGEELVVVMSPLFPHRISKGYDNPQTKVVKDINGIPIKNLRHLVGLLRDLREKYTVIRFDDKDSETIVLNHQEAIKATDEILADNGVRQQASDDLIAVWSQKK
jgi:S1-C subfamily serine protease